jgi:hypothetical protein
MSVNQDDASNREKRKVSKKEKRTPMVMEFARSHQKWLMTTRFNNATWEENELFRKRYPKIKCIYPAQEPITHTIPQDSILFVLEMNNDTNKIMGVGILKNHAICDHTKYRVYSNQNYNRYSYLGSRRIDRSEMTEKEETIMKVFDILCFKGARHMKRLRGIKAFPLDILYRCKEELDLVYFIRGMFKDRISNIESNQNT